MKKCIIFLFLILLIPVSGCSIDYTSYYEKYGDVVNREDPTKGLVSSKIEEGVLEYPLSNGEYGTDVKVTVAGTYKFEVNLTK